MTGPSPLLKLNNGVEMPALGLGVYQSSPEECGRIVGDLLTSEGKPVVYRPGSWGPAEADRLVTDDHWLPLENV